MRMCKLRHVAVIAGLSWAGALAASAQEPTEVTFGDDEGAFREGIDDILTAEGSLRAAGVPTERRYRRVLFEDWISANFSGFSVEDRTRGTVQILWAVGVDDDPNDYPGNPRWDDEWAAEVILPEPNCQRIAGGLNELGVTPVAAHVPKQVCLRTDGIEGGTAIYCRVVQRSGAASSPVAPRAA